MRENDSYAKELEKMDESYKKDMEKCRVKENKFNRELNLEKKKNI